ncbi:MAG: quinolinate synthase [Flavobacteriales bacterium]|nr:quinolinate synthase [Flavobacteriales bacterium]|tara:strand:- start:120599 stop:121600 length:1002 start_codon:yes stop_codon:yes gene_type:complete
MISQDNFIELEKKGYLERDIDPTMDLFEEIEKLKKEKNAVILAHYYQEGDIQDIADFVGDSLALAQKAANTDADIILFAGVEFMAETAKILSPQKKVLLPDLNAGCSLAESCPADEFARFKEDRPDHIVISYVNCSAEVKALTDIVCTSSNAVQIIESLPQEQKIIFGPDRNLGAYLEKKTGREMAIWDGSCMVHEIFSLEKIIHLKAENPDAQIIAHPECEAELLEHAAFIGSTAALLRYSKESSCSTFIVATESGILHQMQKEAPEKTFIPAPPNNTCACNDCPHMRLNTLEKLYNCLKYELPEMILPEELIGAAKQPIVKMLEISERLGL